jgi:Nucleotide modification associated domain 2
VASPMIRTSAGPGDGIFGFAANSLHGDNRLIYVARVSEHLDCRDYYGNPAYRNPLDCIYEFDGERFHVRRGARCHGTQRDLKDDVGEHGTHFERSEVLLSRDFRYFGADRAFDFTDYPKLRNALNILTRGHRVNHSRALEAELTKLEAAVFRNFSEPVLGKPTEEPRRGRSHRRGRCAVIPRLAS